MVAEIIAGRKRRFAPAAIPAVCFTDPEVVVAGLSPAKPRSAGIDVHGGARSRSPPTAARMSMEVDRRLRARGGAARQPPDRSAGRPWARGVSELTRGVLAIDRDGRAAGRRGAARSTRIRRWARRCRRRRCGRWGTRCTSDGTTDDSAGRRWHDLRPARRPCRSAGLLCVCPRRRRRHAPHVHGSHRERAGRARRSDLAFPVPLHGARLQAAGSSEGSPWRRPGGCPGGGDAAAWCTSFCRRQVVRRAHDFPGASCPTATAGAGHRLRRLSAPSRRQAFDRARGAPGRRPGADALPARDARHAGRPGTSSGT